MCFVFPQIRSKRQSHQGADFDIVGHETTPATRVALQHAKRRRPQKSLCTVWTLRSVGQTTHFFTTPHLQLDLCGATTCSFARRRFVTLASNGDNSYAMQSPHFNDFSPERQQNIVSALRAERCIFNPTPRTSSASAHVDFMVPILTFWASAGSLIGEGKGRRIAGRVFRLPTTEVNDNKLFHRQGALQVGLFRK